MGQSLDKMENERVEDKQKLKTQQASHVSATKNNCTGMLVVCITKDNHKCGEVHSLSTVPFFSKLFWGSLVPQTTMYHPGP